MKISVIIPFRNAEAHLGRCIESCKQATVISTEDNSFRTGKIGQRIREAFPEPSRWEKHA